jgi:hypothetical protein
MSHLYECHDLSVDHVVIELHEALTAPSLAVELHVVQDSDTGETIAWWEDENGTFLLSVAIGCA